MLVPLTTWEALLASWRHLVERIEDQEDRAVLQEWLTARESGASETITLEALEQELRVDNLLLR